MKLVLLPVFMHLKSRGRALFQRPKPIPKVREPAKDASELYNRGVACFEAGDLTEAVEDFDGALRIFGFSHVVDGGGTFEELNTEVFSEFERAFKGLLERAHAEADEAEVPFLREHPNFGSQSIPDGFKLLFIYPKYTNADSKYVECPYKEYFFEPAKNAGLDVSVFHCDRLLLDIHTPEAQNDLRLLREMIAEVRPHAIFYDTNYLGNASNLNADIIADLKAEFGFKAIGYLGDAWGEHWVAMADYWASCTDVIMHIAPGGAVEKNAAQRDKLYCSPCPVDTKTFFPSFWRSFDISFSGSYGAFLRPFWLTHAKIEAENIRPRFLRNRLRGNYFLNVHRQMKDAPSSEEYARIIRRSLMSLNFSTRLHSIRALTGRPWQVLNSGVLLLEEANDPIQYYCTHPPRAALLRSAC